MIYIHIPFCQKICPFCSFAVRKNRQFEHENYLNLLEKEMQFYQKQWKQITKQNLSVYIGGGTPSSLNLKHVQRLLENLDQYFEISSDVEITFEINPEDAQLEYLQGLLDLGINRFSLGIQSFCDEVLKILERCHDAKQAYASLELLDAIGSNYSIDLMFGIPNQTREQWLHDLEIAAKYQPPHISLYGLTIEPRTSFDQKTSYKKWIHDNESLCEQMYRKATEILSHIQIQNYEVSNFAQEGFESKANLLVWNGTQYLGLGIGAHSFFHKQRQANTRSLKIYQDKLHAGKSPIDFHESLSDIQLFNESLALGLRQRKGFDTFDSNQMMQKWHHEKRAILDQLCHEGYANWNGSHFVLTIKGLLLADTITVALAIE